MDSVTLEQLNEAFFEKEVAAARIRGMRHDDPDYRTACIVLERAEDRYEGLLDLEVQLEDRKYESH